MKQIITILLLLFPYFGIKAQTITINHTYDENGALTETIADTVTTSYGLDAVGNRVQYDIDNAPPPIVLPVTWLSFEVEPLETQESLLEWQTASEQNSDYFEIQHSTGVSNFDSVGIVQSVGNSSSISEYSFTHDRPDIGMNYYRLKQVDVDGEFEYSEIRSVYFSASDQAELVLYPNPTDSKLKISLEGFSYSDKIQFSVYDTQGNLVKSNPVFSEDVWIMDVSHLTNGTYVLQVRYEHDSKRAKFVVVD